MYLNEFLQSENVRLTEGEKKVMKVIFTDMKTKEIARHCYLAQSTTSHVLGIIYRKFDVDNRIGLFSRYVQFLEGKIESKRS